MKPDKNSKQAFPPLINQLQNDNSQIINYYINLTHNLNMNNVGYESMLKFPLSGDSVNSDGNQENPNQALANAALFNTYINMRNYFNILQMQASCNQFSQLHSHMNNYQSNQNNKKQNQNLKLVGKKRKMETQKDYNDEISKKTDNNFKNIINIKNGSLQKNKNECNDQPEKNKNSNDVIRNKIISQTSTKQNSEIPEKKSDNKSKDNNKVETEPKEEKKNKVTRKRNKYKYKELLQDILLEHLDKEKKDISIVIDNSSFEPPKSSSKNKRSQKKNKKILNFKKSNSTKNKNDRNTQIKSQRCKSNSKNKKKEKTHTVKFQATEVIFHGDKYVKTKSAIDFMKYNYNFIEEIKQPKIGDAKKQAADIDLPRIIYKNNYENNKYNLSDIKPIWLRSKFKGNNTDLENKIKLIKEENKDGRNIINEEKCLEKLLENSKVHIKN